MWHFCYYHFSELNSMHRERLYFHDIHVKFSRWHLSDFYLELCDRIAPKLSYRLAKQLLYGTALTMLLTIFFTRDEVLFKNLTMKAKLANDL